MLRSKGGWVLSGLLVVGCSGIVGPRAFADPAQAQGTQVQAVASRVAPAGTDCDRGLAAVALPMPSDAEPAICPVETPGSSVSDFAPARPPRFTYCRCSCGYPCETDADCGGALGSCRTGITCC